MPGEGVEEEGSIPHEEENWQTGDPVYVEELAYAELGD
jgi:hypothetical protein